MEIDPETQGWVERNLPAGGTFLSAKRIAGATSASVFHIYYSVHEKIEACILRLFTNREWLAVEPDIPHHEAAALEFISRADLPVPQLMAVDETGVCCGVPALLMTEIPGQVDLLPRDMDSWLTQQAQFLLRLHELDGSAFLWHYRAYNQAAALQIPPESKHPELWERAIEIIRSPSPSFKTCFIHRDFHPVNLLWQNEALSGVVDWVNACQGPAGIDVGWCRHNLAGMYGVAAADRFLLICQQVMGTTWSYHPYWDLITLLDLLPHPFEVYTPWADFGLSQLTREILTQRDENYLSSLLSKF